MLPEPGESWRILLETGNSQPATGRPTHTEKHMSKIIHRLRHFLAMCKWSAKFGPFGKAPF